MRTIKNNSIFNALLIIFIIFLWCNNIALASAPTSHLNQKLLKQEISKHHSPKILENKINQLFREKNLKTRLALLLSVLDSLNELKQPYLYGMLNVGAGELYFSINNGNRSSNIEQAIYHYHKALKVYSQKIFSKKWWATNHNNIAIAYGYRIQGARAKNIDSSLHHFQQTLKVYTSNNFPDDWALTQYSIAVSYYDRVNGDRAKNLEQAIYHFERSLKVRTPHKHLQDWAASQLDLAAAYIYRIHGKRAENLENAIHHSNKALTILTRPKHPGSWARVHNNLGIAYFERIYGDRAENLENSIEHHNKALKIRTRWNSPTNWAASQHNIATSYWHRISGNRAVNLENAIRHYKNALQVRTAQKYPKKWAATQNNLAMVYRDRISGDREKNIEQAIYHCQQALEIRTRKQYPKAWSTTQNNLAIAYLDRIRGNKSENIELSIHHFRQALMIRTRQNFPFDWAATQNNLGMAYHDRIRGDKTNNLTQAVKHYKSALTIYTQQTDPDGFTVTVHYLSRALIELRQWQATLEQLDHALKANEALLYKVSFTPAARNRLMKIAEALFANAVWACLQSGEYTKAFQYLEWGKARMLRHNLALDSVYLKALPSTQYKKLKQLQRNISALENKLQHHRIQKTDAKNQKELHSIQISLKAKSQKLQQMLQNIGVKNTEAPEASTIRIWLASIPTNSTLIAPIFTEFGSAVFIIPAHTSNITKNNIVLLDGFSRKDLQEMLRGNEKNSSNSYLNLYKNWSRTQNKKLRARKRRAWQEQLISILSKLETVLLKPIVNKLCDLGVKKDTNLIIMPDSDTALLPLHSTTLNNQPMLAHYSFQYTPSFYSWYTALQRIKHEEKTTETLLSVINPSGDPKLKYTLIEGEMVSSFFSSTQQTNLDNTSGSYDNLKQALLRHPTYIHLSTHGTYDWQYPLESGLLLANKERLTLADLVSNIDLSNSRLVVLSACETGLSDISLPTEALGLPTGFLQAGAPGIISTLWMVSDSSTMFLMGKFYELHIKKGIEPANALGQAQEWLRTATVIDLRNWLSLHLPKENSKQFLPILKLKEELGKLAMKNPEYRLYSEPYYWAGFIYTGV